MRAGMIFAVVLGATAMGACHKQPPAEQNAAIDINSVSPNDIEALPPDESSETPSNELVNGMDNPNANGLNASGNSY